MTTTNNTESLATLTLAFLSQDEPSLPLITLHLHPSLCLPTYHPTAVPLPFPLHKKSPPPVLLRQPHTGAPRCAAAVPNGLLLADGIVPNIQQNLQSHSKEGGGDENTVRLLCGGQDAGSRVKGMKASPLLLYTFLFCAINREWLCSNSNRNSGRSG